MILTKRASNTATAHSTWTHLQKTQHKNDCFTAWPNCHVYWPAFTDTDMCRFSQGADTATLTEQRPVVGPEPRKCLLVVVGFLQGSASQGT